MITASFNPPDYPDHRGPRPPELIDDPLDVDFDETTARASAAIADVDSAFRKLESDTRGLTRSR